MKTGDHSAETVQVNAVGGIGGLVELWIAEICGVGHHQRRIALPPKGTMIRTPEVP